MQSLDLIVLIAVLGLTLVIGFAGGRAAGDSEDFLLAGRSLPWWAAGTSMVATTFAVDTPLVVAGVTATGGIAANWFWWGLLTSHLLITFALAARWRATGCVTDAEVVLIRHGDGGAARALRRLRALYFMGPINLFVLGWVLHAGAKVIGALIPFERWLGAELLARLALGGLDGAASIGLVLALIIALAYGVFAGLRGVVWTDLFQFSLAMIGAVALAVAAYDVCGGAAGVVALLDGRSAGMPAADLQVVHALAPFAGSFAAASAPPLAPPLDLVGGHGDLVLTALLLSWWATKNADGGGVIIQRLLACKSRRDATWAMGWFTAAHYLLRPWAWLAVGLVLAAVFALPPAQGFEGSYPDAMLSLLPPGVLGLALGGMVAALVSTADTHLHWGASYLANDLLPEGASDARRLWWSRAVQPLLAIVAAVIAANLSSIAAAWKILFVLGAGLGAPTLLRWFVGAIDARGELAAFATSSVTAAVVLWGPWPRPSFAVQMAIVGGVGLLTTVIAAWKFPGDHRRAARFMALTDAAGARWWRPCFGALVCLLCAAACGTRALAGEVAPLALMVLSLSAYALLLYRYGAALPQEGS